MLFPSGENRIRERLCNVYKLKKFLSPHPEKTVWQIFIYIYFLTDIIYLFLERGEGRERGRDISMCGFLSCATYWGPCLQPRHVPWLGIKLMTLWLAGWCSIHWVTMSRAIYFLITILASLTTVLYCWKLKYWEIHITEEKSKKTNTTKTHHGARWVLEHPGEHFGKYTIV